MVNLLQTQMKMMSRQYLEELPEYSGDIELWPIFYRQFVETTEQGGYDDLHNLCRLRKCLKGEARNAVKGVLALPNALSDVIRILKNRFGRIDIIVKKKLKMLNEIAVPNENKPVTIIRFYEYLQDLAATLINAEAEDYLRSPQTLDAIVEKLPSSIGRSWIKRKMKTDLSCTLFDFIEFFETYYEYSLLAEPEYSKEFNHNQKKGSGRVNVHSENESSQKPEIKPEINQCDQCRFCRKVGHTIIKCFSFLKLSNFKKWRFVKHRGLCFNCLASKKVHTSKECNIKIKCNYENCQELYHYLLHRHDKNTNGDKTNIDVNLSNSSKCETKPSCVNIHSADICNKTYFRVLPVTLYNPQNNLKVTTWAFMDEGSSPTMLSNDLAQMLDVNGVQEELCTT